MALSIRAPSLSTSFQLATPVFLIFLWLYHYCPKTARFFWRGILYLYV